MIPKLSQIALLVGVSLWLTGCAFAPAVNKTQADTWQVRGKIGCRLDGRGGPLTFKWRQQDAHYQVDFFSPLGSGRVRVEGAGNRFVVKEATGALRSIATHGGLMRYLGIDISALSWWLRGQPHPNIPHTPLPDGFEQQGWQLSILRAAKDKLPDRLAITADAVSCKIRLLKWRLTDERG